MTSVATYRFAEPPDQVSGVQFRYLTPTRLETVAPPVVPEAISMRLGLPTRVWTVMVATHTEHRDE